MLSVIRSERDKLTSEVSELRQEIYGLSPTKEDLENASRIKGQLNESEQKCAELSKKLNSTIDEKEENIAALQSVIDARTLEAQVLNERAKTAEMKQDELGKLLDDSKKLVAEKQRLLDEMSNK